jgi:RNA polymerase sigma factor (sigma-70 family)
VIESGCRFWSTADLKVGTNLGCLNFADPTLNSNDLPYPLKLRSALEMSETAKQLVERLFAGNRTALLSFFRRFVREPSDARDLAQEVYLRMLRVRDTDKIQNPEGYLFTVAANLVKEQRAVQRRHGLEIDAADENIQMYLTETTNIDSEIDHAVRVRRLRVVLKQLSPKGQAVIMLQYMHGMSHQEIAERIGISPRMVKKYLAKGIAQCRLRMGRLQ